MSQSYAMWKLQPRIVHLYGPWRCRTVVAVWLVFAQKCCDRSIFNLHPSNSQHHCAPTHCKCSDYDEDCAEGLVCWYDEDETGDLPPGCAGTPQPGSEYCIDPRAPPYVFPKILKDRVGLDACVGDW